MGGESTAGDAFAEASSQDPSAAIDAAPTGAPITTTSDGPPSNGVKAIVVDAKAGAAWTLKDPEAVKKEQQDSHIEEDLSSLKAEVASLRADAQGMQQQRGM